MPLADTGLAIGAVTQLLKEYLLELAQGVTVGRPEPPSGTAGPSRLNLFLYEVQFDGHLRNRTLDEDRPAPLWLVLRYLLTAFDGRGESDSVEAHELLGRGIQKLQDINFLSLARLRGRPSSAAALSDNPDMLKLTFDEASAELLSKLMQGSEEKYRCSVGFQVRPVMIAGAEPPAYSLLVGVDYEHSTLPGEAAVEIPVLASMGPTIRSLSPERFEVGSSFTVIGTDLDLSGLSVMLGPVALPVTSQRPDRLTCKVIPSLAVGGMISAGSHPVWAAQALPTGRMRRSNLLIGDLLPQLETATPGAFSPKDPAHPEAGLVGSIQLEGVLLGTKDDDVLVGLYREGKVVQVFDKVRRAPGDASQTKMEVEIETTKAVPPGTYRVILRVNGQQALKSPEVVLRPP